MGRGINKRMRIAQAKGRDDEARRIQENLNRAKQWLRDAEELPDD